MQGKEEIFWEWFRVNNSKYYDLNSLFDPNEKEGLLNAFLYQLHKYNPNLYFEIGGALNESQELIISAEGNVKYFADVEALVAKAPKLSNWHIIAFKPPMGVSFVTNYEGVKLDPREIWFLPLINEKKPTLLGIRMCFPSYEKHKEKIFIRVAYQVLDTILGEKSVALDLEYVEVNELPPKPEEEGLIELVDLPAYIKWHKGIKK